jgi:hypothetical protein
MEKIIKNKKELKALDLIYRYDKESKIKYWFIGIIAFLLIVLFLPWTQNIATKGSITTLHQEHRPQEIHSPIPGKIVKWYVKEGDYVKAGDTILKLTEIKSDYLDPNLVSRTQQQVDAKKGTVDFYKSKIKTTEKQIVAIENAGKLKIEQLKNKLGQLNNKLLAEKAEFEAINNESNIAKDQFERQEKMFEQGLVSQTQLQQRIVSYQNILAKKTMIENKIAQTKKPVIISTGGANEKQIDDVVKFFNNRKIPLAINHCVSKYPSEDYELELNQIDYLRRKYPNNVIGFSTHEYNDWESSMLISYAKGARTWERHIDIPYPDNLYILKNSLYGFHLLYDMIGYF